MSERFALLAAINDYGERSGLESLRFAEADARATAEVLQNLCGFQPPTVLLGENATRAAIIRALEAYRNRSPELFLFFFAGHGELLRGSGTYSLHCYDSRAADTVETLPLTEWADRIRVDVGAQSNIVLVDACRNKLHREIRARGASAAASGLDASVSSTLKEVANRDIGSRTRNSQYYDSRMYMLLGCSAGQVSYEDDKLQHGVFTHALIEEIRERGTRLPLGDLRKQIGARTLKWSRAHGFSPVQVPEWIEPSLPGDVWLRPQSTPNEPETRGRSFEVWQLLGQAKLLESQGQLLEARGQLLRAKQLASESSTAAEEVDAVLDRVRGRIRETMALEPRAGVRLKTLGEWADWALSHPEDAPNMMGDPKLPGWLMEALERPDAAQALTRRTASSSLWSSLGGFLEECAVLTTARSQRLRELKDEIENWLASGEALVEKRKFAAAREMFSLAAERDPDNPRIAAGVQAAEAGLAEESQWKRAEQAGAFELYRLYLSQYPQGWYANEARARQGQLDTVAMPPPIPPPPPPQVHSPPAPGPAKGEGPPKTAGEASKTPEPLRYWKYYAAGGAFALCVLLYAAWSSNSSTPPAPDPTPQATGATAPSAPAPVLVSFPAQLDGALRFYLAADTDSPPDQRTYVNTATTSELAGKCLWWEQGLDWNTVWNVAKTGEFPYALSVAVSGAGTIPDSTEKFSHDFSKSAKVSISRKICRSASWEAGKYTVALVYSENNQKISSADFEVETAVPPSWLNLPNRPPSSVGLPALPRIKQTTETTVPFKAEPKLRFFLSPGGKDVPVPGQRHFLDAPIETSDLVSNCVWWEMDVNFDVPANSFRSFFEDKLQARLGIDFSVTPLFGAPSRAPVTFDDYTHSFSDPPKRAWFGDLCGGVSGSWSPGTYHVSLLYDEKLRKEVASGDFRVALGIPGLR